MNNFEPSQHNNQDRSLKRRFSNINPKPPLSSSSSSSPSLPFMANSNNKTFTVLDNDDDLVSTVVPSVTVVLEGRSICQRINLHKHSSYHSLAMALRQMFADGAGESIDTDLDLTNAVPGHLVAYEDTENDLLLAGDLSWKDFVRVAKRIRIMPLKVNSKKGRGGAA